MFSRFTVRVFRELLILVYSSFPFAFEGGHDFKLYKFLIKAVNFLFTFYGHVTVLISFWLDFKNIHQYTILIYTAIVINFCTHHSCHYTLYVFYSWIKGTR